MTDVPQTAEQKQSTTSGFKHWLVLAGVASLVILVDQISKAYVAAHLGYEESWMPIKFINPIFRFTNVHNTGAAFGMFPEGNLIFSILAVIVSAIIVYYYRQLTNENWLVRVALGLQIGGALGNFIDRVRQGYVIDFLHLQHWPVSNVADICIVSGVVLLSIEMLLEDRRIKQEQADT